MSYDIILSSNNICQTSFSTYSYKQFMLDFLPLPPHAIPLGRCVEDGLPVLMSIDYVEDKNRRSQVFIGNLDYSRNVLRSIIRFVNDDGFPAIPCVVTPFPEMWEDVVRQVNIPGFRFFPSYTDEAQDFMNNAYEYNHGGRHLNLEKILLLIDDYSAIRKMDFDPRNAFCDIVSKPSRNVFVFTTSSEKDSVNLPYYKTNLWTEFHQRGDCMVFPEKDNFLEMYPLK